jgi:hypothetical protein
VLVFGGARSISALAVAELARRLAVLPPEELEVLRRAGDVIERVATARPAT